MLFLSIPIVQYQFTKTVKGLFMISHLCRRTRLAEWITERGLKCHPTQPMTPTISCREVINLTPVVETMIQFMTLLNHNAQHHIPYTCSHGCSIHQSMHIIYHTMTKATYIFLCIVSLLVYMLFLKEHYNKVLMM